MKTRKLREDKKLIQLKKRNKESTDEIRGMRRAQKERMRGREERKSSEGK